MVDAEPEGHTQQCMAAAWGPCQRTPVTIPHGKTALPQGWPCLGLVPHTVEVKYVHWLLPNAEQEYQGGAWLHARPVGQDDLRRAGVQGSPQHWKPQVHFGVEKPGVTRSARLAPTDVARHCA